jgi:hypothetical protein
MPITSYVVVQEDDLGNGWTEVEYEFRDHNYPNSDTINFLTRVPTGTDYDADMASRVPEIDEQLQSKEVSRAVKLAREGRLTYPFPFEHQAKPDFLRRFFGEMMGVRDIVEFNGSYAFFQAFETDPDTGNNKPQREAYLGLDGTDYYNQIDKRYGDMSGIQVILNDEKGRVWDELPDGYW